MPLPVPVLGTVGSSPGAAPLRSVGSMPGAFSSAESTAWLTGESGPLGTQVGATKSCTPWPPLATVNDGWSVYEVPAQV